MKKLNNALFLCAIFSLLCLSCSKAARNAEYEEDSLSNNFDPQATAAGKSGGKLIQTVVGDLGADLTNLTFCSAKSVPLCAGQNINVGEVLVQTAINGRTYVTYILKGLWYFKEIHLFAGEDGGIPVNNSGSPVPGQFPFTKTFTTPFNVQKYSFVIDGLDEAYVVAAHASVVKLASNGNQIGAETAWGDGCTGKKITEQGNWGTFMNYVGSACTIVSASSEIVNMCSNSVDTYFWVNPTNPAALTWRNPVTVGGYTYTEQEARALVNALGAGEIADSKYAFMRVATIKLSNTEYELSPVLSGAIKTVEDWLKTVNKLSPVNLPTGNPVVKNAATMIDSWIVAHTCSVE